jgi:hypothetical protein
MEPSYNIISFGCWNNKYNKNFLFLQKITEKIMSNIHNYNLLVILGDNYYPEKIKIDNEKYEIIKKEEIREGFDILNKIKLDKRFIFGNHDIVFVKKPPIEKINNEIKQLSLKKSELELQINELQSEINNLNHLKRDDLDKCSILETELETVLETELTMGGGGNSKFKFLFDKEIVTNNNKKTLLLYIDTSIYEIESEINCYQNKFFTQEIRDENKEQEKDIHSLRNMQNNFITKSIEEEEDCENILIFGHEPIITFKSKKKEGNKIGIIKNLADKLFEIKHNVKNKDKNFYYICADNHLHQKSQIKFNGCTIYQYVFGTGGTCLDNSPLSNSERIHNYTIEIDNQYHEILNSSLETWRGEKIEKINEKNGTEEYGYGVIQITGSNIEIFFKQIDPIIDQTGGYYKHKYYKYKSKIMIKLS